MNRPVDRPVRRSRGAIFDLDGVLVDTVPLHFRAWKRVFEARGIAFDEDDYLERVDGRTQREGARAMMPDADEREVEAAAERKQALFAEALRGGLRAFDSSVALVHRLADAGIRLAVASGGADIAPVLERIGIAHRLGAVVGGADVARGKPHPETFLAAARALRLDPGDCIVFEDAVAGVRAAERGGFRCIGVDRHGRPERLRGAEAIVADLGELDPDTLFELGEGDA